MLKKKCDFKMHKNLNELFWPQMTSYGIWWSKLTSFRPDWSGIKKYTVLITWDAMCSDFLAWLKWKGLLHFLEKLGFNHWNAPYRTLTTSKMSKNILKHVDPPSYQNNILEILVAFSQAFKIESFAKISRFAPKI